MHDVRANVNICVILATSLACYTASYHKALRFLCRVAYKTNSLVVAA